MNKSFWRRRWLNWCRATLLGQTRRGLRTRSHPRFEFLEDRLTPSLTAQFGLANESLLETAGTFSIPVLLSSISATATTIPFTLGGNATDFTDYNGLTASPVVIPAGQIGVDITGTLLTPNDGVKTLTFTLGTPTGATLGATTVNTMTIAEPTANPTTLSIANTSAIEPGLGGTVNMVFTVTRTGDLTSQITVGYTTVAGTAQPATDFTPETGTTTFASGSATATISIPILHDDVISSPTLTFSVQLTGIVSEFGPPVTFADHSDFATATQPFSVALADLNGDGKPDIVTVSYSSQTVSVLLNTTPPGATTPSFAPMQTFSAGHTPTSVALGDVNGDGRPDIIVTNFDFDTVTVLLNTTPTGATTASFAAGQTFVTASNAVRVVLGDVNGDGKPDIIVGDATKVSVLLNTTTPGSATASFAPEQSFATGSGASVALADINGDGKPDIIVANQSDNTVSVLLNTTTPGAATPSFAPKQTFATGSGPFNVVVGDLNGDGLPDLVVTNAGDNTVSVLLNTTTPGAATASFATQQTFATGAGPAFVAVRDVNGDGLPDLIVSNEGADSVSVLRNMTTPGATTLSFATQQTFATGAGGDAYSVAVADINGDGLPDLVVVNKQDNTVSVLLNTTVLGAATITPAFPQAATAAIGSQVFAVAVGDINGDGKPDLVVSNFGASTVSVLMNTTPPGSTTPSFAPPQTFATGFARFVTLGDLNGDGLPDIIVANAGNNTVSVLLNTTTPGSTTASFAAQQTFAAGSAPISVALADVNGDGELDLIVADSNPGAETVSVLLNTTPTGATTATFATAQTFAVGNQPFSVAVGDVNGDGKPDIITANTDDNTVSVLLNTTPTGATTASFAAQQTFATGGDPSSVALADINGDGEPDIVVANGDDTVSVLLNTTTPGAAMASFATQQTFAIGSDVNTDSLALGDVNGDGKPDIVVASEGSSKVSVLLNTTLPGAATASFTAQQTFATQTASEAVALVDVNGDFRPDILAAGFSGTVSVLLNTPVTIPGNTATGTITEPAGTPTVQFSTASETIDESAGTFSITVTLSSTSGSSVSVPFTLGGTAVSGTDYSGVTTSPLSIAAGDTTATITGTLLSDPGASKSLTFTLGTPTDATLGGATVNTLTITEPAVTPTVQFSTASETINESTGTFSITVALSTASASTVGIPFTLGGTAVSGTDFSGVTASPLSIAAGVTTATITGTLLSDPGASPTLIFTLGTPTNANLGATTVNTLTMTEPSGTTVSLSGTIFFDYNVNGVLDSGEPGLAGRTVFLDLKNSGALDAGDPSTITAADGSYEFTDLAPGTYTVRELIQYDNVDVTGAGASRVVVANANVAGINIGNLLYNPAFPVFAVANLYTPSPNTDATTAYVHGLYQAVLDRAAEPQGLAYWVGLLQSGMTKAAVDYSFVNSKEHRQDEVAYYYENFLGEAPDAASAVWVTDLMNGENEEEVVQGILTMPAYTTLHPSDADFVTDLYFHLLGRQADSGGLAHWEQLLAAGTTRAAIVTDFFQSTDESATLASHGFFAAYLHRAPDPMGDAFWIGQLQTQTQSFGQVAAGYFYTTPEYQDNADQSVT
ncbi:MAG TPA: FG-GAP-like repeat-containing protein [Gemmataceae bacterium]|nr:FG-GAP-like repeat-containing protein [Gemmataceae bacterium]